MTKLSVIIVSWNTAEITCNCIRSIYEQTYDISFEIIVVDNASSDNSVQAIKTDFPNVILVENKTNAGFGKANNQGMNLARGKYLLLLNSDTIVLKNALGKVVSFADTNPDAGVIGCRVLNSDRTLQNTCYMFPSIINWLLFTSGLYKVFSKNKFFGKEQMSWWNRDDVREVDVVTGCFMLLPIEVFKQTGGFDERFFMYCEETDWCWRIKQAGWKCLFTPEAEIIHLGGASAAKYGAKRAKIKDDSTIKFMFKHWSKGKALTGLLMMILFYVSRLIFTLPLSFIPKYRKISTNHLYGLWNLLFFYKTLFSC